jgi:hypothetical protein
MTTSSDPFLADAFFDSPGLLAVRFARRNGSGVDRSLSAFVTSRRPDVTTVVDAGSIAKLIGIGIGVIFIGLPMLRSFTSVEYDSTTYDEPVTVRTQTMDSVRNTAWASGLERLADDLMPQRTDLQPYLVRTLLDVPRDVQARGASADSWMQPRCSDDDAKARERGERLAHLMTSAGAGRELAVILDLPGSESVSAAAGMATRFIPVFTMDNLPHSAGVVPSMRTLESIVYWRPTFVRAQATRSADAPAVFVLDGNRLNPYANEVERFDNRSAVRLPDVDGCKALGITRILYVRGARGNVAERDDLNELFSEFAAAGIEVKHIALESMDPVHQVVEQPVEKTDEQTTKSSSHTTWFWRLYGWYRPSGTTWKPTPDPDAAYRATPRPTMFSHHVTPPGFDGGRSQRDSVITRLVPPPRPVSSGYSGSSSSYRSSSGSSSSSSHNSGGSWSRSTSSHFSG